MKPMAKIDLAYVQALTDRHGHKRHYYRRAGFERVTLPGVPGSAEFMTAYAAADARAPRKPEPRTAPRSIGARV